MREKTRDRLGQIAVGAVLAGAIMLTGCGGDREPQASENPRLPRQAPVSVQPAAVVSDAPLPERTPVPTGPVSYETAEQAWREGRYGEAVHLFTRYIEDRPGNPWGHYMLGLSARQVGDLTVAERAFETALAADPDHVKSLHNLARVQLDAERPEDALASAEQAILLDPQSPVGYRLQGLAFADLGESIEAIVAWRVALLLDSTDAWSANNLGLLHIREGRYTEAIGPLARAVEVRPDVAVFRNNLGVALERTGHTAQAVEHYREAVTLGHPRAGVSLARVESRATVSDPTVDLSLAASAFLLGLEMGVVDDEEPVDTVPGFTLNDLWDDVLFRHGVR